MCPNNSKKNSAGWVRRDEGGGGSWEALRALVRTWDYLLNETGNHWGFVEQTDIVLKVHSGGKKKRILAAVCAVTGAETGVGGTHEPACVAGKSWEKAGFWNVEARAGWICWWIGCDMCKREVKDDPEVFYLSNRVNNITGYIHAEHSGTTGERCRNQEWGFTDYMTAVLSPGVTWIDKTLSLASKSSQAGLGINTW